MLASPHALVAMVVDAESEGPAQAIAQGFIDAAGLAALRIEWRPYPKLGPHSRISFRVTLPPCPDGQAVIDAIEAFCGHCVTPEGLKTGHVTAFFNDDGSLFYNRIFDVRTDPFLLDGVLWLDVEINTNSGAQADMAKLSEAYTP